MVVRQDKPQEPHSNGATAPPHPSEGPIAPKDILRAAAELSRKLQWAIGTTWYNTTGVRAPKKQVDHLATTMAADAIDQLLTMHQHHIQQ